MPRKSGTQPDTVQYVVSFSAIATTNLGVYSVTSYLLEDRADSCNRCGSNEWKIVT